MCLFIKNLKTSFLVQWLSFHSKTSFSVHLPFNDKTLFITFTWALVLIVHGIEVMHPVTYTSEQLVPVSSSLEGGELEASLIPHHVQVQRMRTPSSNLQDCTLQRFWKGRKKKQKKKQDMMFGWTHLHYILPYGIRGAVKTGFHTSLNTSTKKVTLHCRLNENNSSRHC